MSTQTFSILLVSRNAEEAWLKRFISYFAEMSTPDLVKKSEVLDKLRQTQYDIIFIDETTLLGDYSLIQQILYIQPSARIIVVTDSSDWRRARQAFLFGAVDYVETSIKPDELLKVVQEVIDPME